MVTPEEIQSIKQRFDIIGHSQALNHAIRVAIQVAPTDLTVLITGESGSGKESFSKIIHNLSARKHGQFIAINCGAIPEGTIDSELFGHEKGSFTGATDARKGYFEVTNGGTIFLDEIGEMPLGTQARLLRILENGEFIKVGSSKSQKTDVRVVAATNVNLLEAVQKGKFREDLYYRLNTVPLVVPALRERGNDIDLLFRKFAADFAEKYRVKPVRLTDEAKEILITYRFPGNIRQLKNIAEQISILEMDREISGEILKTYLPRSTDSMLPTLFGEVKGYADSGMSERDLLYKILFDMRRDVTDLKQFVLEMVSRGSVSAESLANHPNLFSGATTMTSVPLKENHSVPVQDISPISPSKSEIMVEEDHPYERVFDISHETEEESLSLQIQEKEMILKALKKNHNRRKNAARDLGISERTLYRKIKLFGIEE
jgi:transcriptional regulator with PAS, ATPase and Fis domain